MTVCFIGCGVVKDPQKLEDQLRMLISSLCERGATRFLTFDMVYDNLPRTKQNFNLTCRAIVREQKGKNAEPKLVYVRPVEIHYGSDYMEYVMARCRDIDFIVSHEDGEVMFSRDCYRSMIDHSSACIFFVDESPVSTKKTSGDDGEDWLAKKDVYEAYLYAQSKEKEICNLWQ